MQLTRIPGLLVVTAALCAVLPAQRKDRIVWTDGTTTKGVRVKDFTWQEIQWNTSRGDDSKTADMVASLQIEAVEDAYKRARGAGGPEDMFAQYQTEAEALVKRKKLYLAQFGYMEMAKIARSLGEMSQCFASLERLVKDCPDSGFYPELYRFKLEYYLSLGKKGAGNAAKVANAYSTTATNNAWPPGFQREAEYYSLMAKLVGGSADAKGMRSELEALLRSTDGSNPSVASRTRVALANLLRDAKDPRAKEMYEKVIKAGNVGETARASALVGLGMISFSEGTPAKTEPYYDALLSFLRVYIETPGASKEVVGQALYYGAQAADKWRGQDSAQMAARLRGYLRRDFRDTSWAKR